MFDQVLHPRPDHDQLAYRETASRFHPSRNARTTRRNFGKGPGISLRRRLFCRIEVDNIPRQITMVERKSCRGALMTLAWRRGSRAVSCFCSITMLLVLGVSTDLVLCFGPGCGGVVEAAWSTLSCNPGSGDAQGSSVPSLSSSKVFSDTNTHCGPCVDTPLQENAATPGARASRDNLPAPSAIRVAAVSLVEMGDHVVSPRLLSAASTTLYSVRTTILLV